MHKRFQSRGELDYGRNIYGIYHCVDSLNGSFDVFIVKSREIMSIVGYETIILAGTMLLLVWCIRLPYDTVMFDGWNVKTVQSPNSHDLQTSIGTTRPITENDYPYNIVNIMEEIAKIAVYLLIPSVILYKMLISVKKELKFSLGY